MADQETVDQRAAERAARKQKNARARRAYRAKQKTKRAEQRAAAPAVEPEVREHGPGRPKVRQGVVVSAKPDKTITVRIDVTRRHRVYKKIVRSSSTLHVHDEKNDANEGDLVRVIESRPISRLKRWRLVEVLERSR
jgi:small subunit ribosomal protein S17